MSGRRNQAPPQGGAFLRLEKKYWQETKAAGEGRFPTDPLKEPYPMMWCRRAKGNIVTRDNTA